MTTFTLGAICGSIVTFIAGVALILFVTRGPWAPDWNDND